MNMHTLNTQIYDEASEWIILHRSDDLDAEAKRRFDAWLRESPQQLRAYLEMSTIWEDVPTLQHDWNPSANELIARARKDSNVFPLALEKTSSPKVPGTGGLGVIGTVPANEEESSFSIPAASGGANVRGSVGTGTVPQASVELAAEPQVVSVERAVTLPVSVTLTKLLSIAATVVLLAGTGIWFYLQRDIYTTEIGEQRILALTDGSSVELNARTKLRVIYTDRERTVELLQGQALFKVAKDSQRPFIVDSAGTHIRAVGTQFDVYKKDTGTQVTVVEGRVAVLAPGHAQASSGGSPNNSESQDSGTAGARRGGAAVADSTSSPHSANVGASADQALQAHLGEVLLSAGEQLTVTAVAPPKPVIPTNGLPANGELVAVPLPVPKLADIEAATAWTQQRLVFDFATLDEVAQEFNRYNRRPLKIDCDDSNCLSDFHVSGSFSSTDPTLLLRFLREQPGIVVTETAEEIRISREDTITG